MRKIAKCPVCGETPLMAVYNIGGEVLNYACCGIKCSTLDIWNQYAAAMEFTKWVSSQHYANGLSKSMIIHKAQEVYGKGN